MVEVITESILSHEKISVSAGITISTILQNMFNFSEFLRENMLADFRVPFL